ncbi:hypothetical protein TanjilG_06127 [Lupinus angustifolius]|uniref:Uncharacterized protein n=1 Tax=Lupinus angustifolius TaxID=3871 RepID=A0A1J7HAY6_LUPAN|nr:hypothetical protein TanjilG_06127 [Lupinus angustifolius]
MVEEDPSLEFCCSNEGENGWNEEGTDNLDSKDGEWWPEEDTDGEDDPISVGEDDDINNNLGVMHPSQKKEVGDCAIQRIDVGGSDI